jgi:hypothetical protein
MQFFDETASPLSLSGTEPALPELWVLEGGLDALLLTLPDASGEAVGDSPIQTVLVTARRLQ